MQNLIIVSFTDYTIFFFSAFLAFSNKEELVMDLVLDGLNMSRVVVIS